MLQGAHRGSKGIFHCRRPGKPSADFAPLTDAARAGAGSRARPGVADAGDIDWGALDGAASVAVTAGASAPEALVERILEALGARYAIAIETLTTTKESMAFPLPRTLPEAAAERGCGKNGPFR